MGKDFTNKMTIKAGFLAGFPVLIGYFPVAVAFGILAKTTGLSLGDSAAFSVLVFAGASQFMALNLIKTGVALGGIVLATFLLNFRHLLMSASLAAKIKEPDKRWLPVVAFGVTDETFAVAATQSRPLGISFLLALEGTAYLGWVTGTLTGYLAGSILPASLGESMGIGLYALFVAILIPGFKKSGLIIALAVGAGFVHTLLNWLNLWPVSWNLVVAIIVSSLLGAWFIPSRTEGFH